MFIFETTTWMSLISIIRHLEENMDDWLAEELENYKEDDYLVFDCPGIGYILCAHLEFDL